MIHRPNLDRFLYCCLTSENKNCSPSSRALLGGHFFRYRNLTRATALAGDRIPQTPNWVTPKELQVTVFQGFPVDPPVAWQVHFFFRLLCSVLKIVLDFQDFRRVHKKSLRRTR